MRKSIKNISEWDSQISKRTVTKNTELNSDSESEVLLNLLTMEPNMDNQSQIRTNLVGFRLLVWITEFLAVLLFLMIFIWLVHFCGGFAWSSQPTLQFNWHPFLMVSGMIILYAQSILIYRLCRDKHKRQLKLIHAVLHALVFLFSLIAMIAVFSFHNNPGPGLKPIANLYSLHSWIGLTTNILFACQYISGFCSFLFPGLQTNIRLMYMPVHVFFGNAGFVFAVASCLTGLNEKAVFKLSSTYQNLPSEGVLINFIGITIIIFATFVLYLVTKPEYRRVPRPEDGSLLPHQID